MWAASKASFGFVLQVTWEGLLGSKNSLQIMCTCVDVHAWMDGWMDGWMDRMYIWFARTCICLCVHLVFIDAGRWTGGPGCTSHVPSRHLPYHGALLQGTCTTQRKTESPNASNEPVVKCPRKSYGWSWSLFNYNQWVEDWGKILTVKTIDFLMRYMGFSWLLFPLKPINWIQLI